MTEPLSGAQRLLPAVVCASITAVVCIAIPPMSLMDSHAGRLVLAALGALLVAVRTALYLRGGGAWGVPAFHAALASAVVVGWFNYYQYDPDMVLEVGDHTDTAYYYTNSKYLPELSHFGLYAAALTADRERGAPRSGHVKHYRDLRDYVVKPVGVALEHGEELRAERFTPERWAAFSHDIQFFLDRIHPRMLERNFFVDHGFNPPPTWSVVGGTLAGLFPVEQLALICHADTLLVAAAFAAVTWAFGPEATLWAMLWFLCTFSGRWPVLGQSLLRFDWVSMLVVSLCMLRRGWFGTAGAALAYAGLNRVFPSIFFLGWIAAALRDTWTEGRIPSRHLRFAGGAGLAGAVLVGGALAAYGPEAFAASGRNLGMHNLSYSSLRVGLGDVLLYRGETTRAQIDARGGIRVKEEAIGRMQPWLRAAGVAAGTWVLVYALRTRREPWELLGLAVLPLFCVTNAQINYYNLRLVLVLWHVAHLRTHPYHRAALAWLFLIEVATQGSKLLHLDRYTTTTTTSILLFAYLLALVAWMARTLVAERRSG